MSRSSRCGWCLWAGVAEDARGHVSAESVQRDLCAQCAAWSRRWCMASKTKAVQKDKEKKEEAPEKEAPETPDTPLPLLDLSDAAVKKLIRNAKKRGYVTHDQINSVLPSEEVNSEQIEDVLAMFSEMGINVVETEEAETEEATEEAREEAEEEESDGELFEVAR